MRARDEAFDLEEFLSALPHKPGVYRMLDGAEQVIYVGKAKKVYIYQYSYQISIYQKGCHMEARCGDM